MGARRPVDTGPYEGVQATLAGEAVAMALTRSSRTGGARPREHPHARCARSPK
jgi:hypothetical protein